MHETIPEAAKKDKGERQKGRNKCRENGILAIEITIIIGGRKPDLSVIYHFLRRAGNNERVFGTLRGGAWRVSMPFLTMPDNCDHA